jgi:hypothetical protein
MNTYRSNADNAFILAISQIVITVLYMGATFWLTGMYLLGYANHLSADQDKTISRFLQADWTTMGIVVFFWFQRLRGGGMLDEPMVTQTHTTPDGSRTVVTSPARAAPLPPVVVERHESP